jgi:hypothetical protein
MIAVKNESGDVPAHDEDAHRNSNKCSTQRIDIAQVFRRKKQGICPESAHETPVNGAAQNIPEQKQYLVFFEVQQYQLNGKRMYKPFQEQLHKVI